MILSADAEAFQQNYQEMLSFLSGMDVEASETFMTENIAIEYERYHARRKGDEQP